MLATVVRVVDNEPWAPMKTAPPLAAVLLLISVSSVRSWPSNRIAPPSPVVFPPENAMFSVDKSAVEVTCNKRDDAAPGPRPIEISDPLLGPRIIALPVRLNGPESSSIERSFAGNANSIRDIPANVLAIAKASLREVRPSPDGLSNLVFTVITFWLT